MEATTLTNMAVVYDATGQPQRALQLLEEALPLIRAVGYRTGEAATLTNMAAVYRTIGQPQRALQLYEQTLTITREVGDRTGEANTLTNLAVLLYQHLKRAPEALQYLQQAIILLETTGLDRDASGTTVATLRQMLAAMRRGEPMGGGQSGPATLPAEQIRVTVSTTIAVLTSVPEQHAAWRAIMDGALQKAHSINRPQDAEFYTVILALLDGQPAGLPDGHPYAAAIAAIQRGVASEGAPQADAGRVMPFDPEIIPRSIVALRGSPQEKMAHGQYLTGLVAQSNDAQLQALVHTIMRSLFDGNLESLGHDLEGIYAQAWAAIVAGIQSEGDIQP
jgi:hypothetical protein